MFQQRFNLDRIHDSVGKALRTDDQGHVTANSISRSIFTRPIKLGKYSSLSRLRPFRELNSTEIRRLKETLTTLHIFIH